MKKLAFLVGESGSGKSTMINYLINKYPETFYYVKSTVTRPPRMGEVDGVSYHFVRQDEFLIRDMVQTIEFGGNHYGTEVQEFQKDQPVGLIAVTPEGILDISRGLDKLGIEMDYEILFFDSTDEILRSRGVEESRINRGNIRRMFKEESNNQAYRFFKVSTLQDDSNLTEEELKLRYENFKELFEVGV